MPPRHPLGIKVSATRTSIAAGSVAPDGEGELAASWKLRGTRPRRKRAREGGRRERARARQRAREAERKRERQGQRGRGCQSETRYIRPAFSQRTVKSRWLSNAFHSAASRPERATRLGVGSSAYSFRG
eukprot:3460915-Rhodomonas_salina.2